MKRIEKIKKIGFSRAKTVGGMPMNATGIGLFGKWCEVHHGPPAFNDTANFECPLCHLHACAMDFFDTADGKMCGNCISKLENAQDYPQFKKQFRIVQARSAIFKLMIVLVEFLILLCAVLLVASGSIKNGIIQSAIGALLVLLGLAAFTVAAFVLSIFKIKSSGKKILSGEAR